MSKPMQTWIKRGLRPKPLEPLPSPACDLIPDYISAWRNKLIRLKSNEAISNTASLNHPGFPRKFLTVLVKLEGALGLETGSSLSDRTCQARSELLHLSGYQCAHKQPPSSPPQSPIWDSVRLMLDRTVSLLPSNRTSKRAGSFHSLQ